MVALGEKRQDYSSEVNPRSNLVLCFSPQGYSYFWYSLTREVVESCSFLLAAFFCIIYCPPVSLPWDNNYTNYHNLPSVLGLCFPFRLSLIITCVSCVSSHVFSVRVLYIIQRKIHLHDANQIEGFLQLLLRSLSFESICKNLIFFDDSKNQTVTMETSTVNFVCKIRIGWSPKVGFLSFGKLGYMRIYWI